jgi:LPXTG-motif cell wall-anchored protein
VLTPGVAHAGVGASGGPTFPTVVTVGQTSVPATITLENRNTAPNMGDTNTVCNAGDASPPCSLPERGIVLVPSCSQLAGGLCTAAGADPGVFAVSATGSGATGTACAGMVFTTAVIDPTFGTVRFTPALGAHVTLPGFASSCVIQFTFDVLKSPTGDQDPATPGIQTAQAVEHTQFVGALSNFARGTSNGTTVLQATPSIPTNASTDTVVGSGQLTDSAAVTGRVNPLAGATVDFRLYGPDDATCSGTPVFQSLNVAYPVVGGAVTSAAFTPTQAGTYRWIASYSGDANNTPVTGACNDASENVSVTAPPVGTPEVSPPTTISGPVPGPVPGPALPRTGSDPALLLLVGLGCIVGGCVLVSSTRRRAA